MFYVIIMAHSIECLENFSCKIRFTGGFVVDGIDDFFGSVCNLALYIF